MPVFKTGAINRSATSPATTVLLQRSMLPGQSADNFFPTDDKRPISSYGRLKTDFFNH
jgi:hypothetical protein